MDFLADANLFVPMVVGLRNMGHDVFDLKEAGLENLARKQIAPFRKARISY